MFVHVINLDTVEPKFDNFDTLRPGSAGQMLEFQSVTGNLCTAWMWHGSCTCIEAEGHMFRISTVETDRERRLVVEGTLVSPWVSELLKSWREAGFSLNDRTLVIDLTNATMIDIEGEAAIFDLMKEGAKFCCGDVLTRHVLKQLAHKCHTKLRNVLNRPGADGSRSCLDRKEQ